MRINKMNSHNEFMDKALQLAEQALEEGEVPIGCVFVYKEQVIACGRNSANKTKNATRHAEINALAELFEYCRSKDISASSVLSECWLYVTVEPCAMCADAIAQLRVGHLVFGCSNDRFGGCGSIINVFKIYNYNLGKKVEKGIRAEEAVDLLRRFYQGTNPNAPTDKAKRKPK